MNKNDEKYILNPFFVYLHLKITIMDNLTVFKQYQQLPNNLKQEVADFISYLTYKYVKNKPVQPKVRKSGALKGLIVYMADDFDAPLADFNDYM